jgi:hypothetical protein
MKKVSYFSKTSQLVLLTLFLVTGVYPKAHAWKLFGKDQNVQQARFTIGPEQNQCFFTIPYTTYFFGFAVSSGVDWVTTDCTHPGIDGGGGPVQ